MALNLEFRPSRVRAIREQLGLTQQQFADRVGVSNGAVSMWESGDRIPSSPAVLQALLDAERAATAPNGEPSADELDAAIALEGASAVTAADLPAANGDDADAPRCAFCGAPDGVYAVSTGSAKHPACMECYAAYGASPADARRDLAAREAGLA